MSCPKCGHRIIGEIIHELDGAILCILCGQVNIIQEDRWVAWTKPAPPLLRPPSNMFSVSERMAHLRAAEAWVAMGGRYTEYERSHGLRRGSVANYRRLRRQLDGKKGK